jgi:hypothetical protein
MNSTFKSVLFWFAIIVAAFGIYQYSSLTPSDSEIPFNEFQARAEKGEIFDAVFNGNKISGTLKPSPVVTCRLPSRTTRTDRCRTARSRRP